jgi:hypothetical protein
VLRILGGTKAAEGEAVTTSLRPRRTRKSLAKDRRTSWRLTKAERDAMADLYMQGWSCRQIAERFGVAEPTAWGNIRRRVDQLRPMIRTGKANYLWRGTQADKWAKGQVQYAIRRGRMQRPSTCQTCGASGTFKDGRSIIQAHHADYNEPFEVMWLCQPCHFQWHRDHKAVARRVG